MLLLFEKQISSTKHTGFEDSLPFYISLSLPLLADFFFAYLVPLSDLALNPNSSGLINRQPFFIITKPILTWRK